jgi:hypothetical protein
MHLKTPIILHRGQTCPLALPHKGTDGQPYPYLFAALTPEVRHWPYRVLPAIHPSEMSETAWKALLTRHGPVLRADWEEIRGHPIGAITVYLTGPKGSGTQSARIELAPPLPMPGNPAATPAPPAPVRPKPQTSSQEITLDMF